MAAQRGRDLLLKMYSSAGNYVTIAGLRSKSIKFNARIVDITHSESLEGWRELLPGAGVKTLQLTGSGIFCNSEADSLARQVFFDQDARQCEIIIPGFGSFKGAFLITTLTYTGTYDGEASYDITLSSAGAPSFVTI